MMWYQLLMEHQEMFHVEIDDAWDTAKNDFVLEFQSKFR
jgi:hypothetical protein